MSIGLDYTPLSGFNPYDNPSMHTDPALAPGGIVEGLGNLASALITTPQKVAQIKMEQQRLNNESDYRKAMIGNNATRIANTKEYQDAIAKIKQQQANTGDARATALAGWYKTQGGLRQQGLTQADAKNQADLTLEQQKLNGAGGAAGGITADDALREANRRALFETGDPTQSTFTDPATGKISRIPSSDAERAQKLPLYRAAVAKQLQAMGWNPDTLQRLPPAAPAGGQGAPPQTGLQVYRQVNAGQQQPPAAPAAPANLPPRLAPAAPASPPPPTSSVNPIQAGLAQMSPQDQVNYQKIVATGDVGRIQAAHARIVAAYAPRPQGAPLGPDSVLGPNPQNPMQPTPGQPGS